MLGSSKSGREYNQDQLLLNSVSSIGIPLSLTTSTTSTTNLLHSVSPLSLNNSNALLTTTSSTNYNIGTPNTSNILQQSINTDNNVVKNQNDKNDNKENERKLVSHETESTVQVKEGEHQKMDIETSNTNIEITSDLKESLSSIEDENTFKLQTESNNNINTEESVNRNDDNLSNSLFNLPLNLEAINDPDGTNDFLNGAIDMNIDLLNTSLTDNLNTLTVDVESTINDVSKSGTETAATTNTPSSFTVTDTDTTTTTTTTATTTTTTTTNATTTTTSTTSASTSTTISSSGPSTSAATKPSENDSNIEVNTSTLILNENNNSTKSSNSDKIKNDPLNALSLVTSDSTSKKELLELFNTEDLENNLKLLQFSNQSLLLPQQKDAVANLPNNTVSIINEQSLTDPNTLSIIADSNTSTNVNASSLSSTTTTTVTSTTETTVIPTVVSSSDSTVNLNSSETTATKSLSTIPGNVNNVITVSNPILEYPSMMNNAAYFNLNTNPNVPNTVTTSKVNYYPHQQTNPIPPNEVMLKKSYNAMVKQENINDIQKNTKNIDTVKNPINCATNSNVKINMKSVKNGAPKGRRVQSRNASLRPTLSYVELITEAICESEDGLLSLQEIYDAIKRKYVYFRTADPAWQNSIRHNLSVHQSFTKITRPPNRPGKGFLWTSSKIDYQNLSSSESRKRRKREHGEKSHMMVTSTNKNQSYHTNYPASSNGSMATNNVPQQNITNNMNDINYILNQQHQPRISQKVMKILTDSSINTPSLKQLLFTGFKHMSNEPYHGHNGNLNYSLNSYDGYHGPTHSSSMYGGGSQYLTNSSTFPGQITNSSMPLSLNTLVMPSVSSSLPASNSAFTKNSSSSFHNSFGNSNSTLPLTNMDNLNSQKYSGSGSSLYPISLLDPEYTFRYPSQSMFRNSYFYQKNDVLMHNTSRRYSFDSAMTSSAAFAAAAAHNNSNPNNPSPPYFSLAKSQSTKNMPSGPNYIKKDREKKIMYEKMHLTNDYNNIVNQTSSSQYTGNTSNYMTTTATSLNFSHKHLPTNYNNNISMPPSSYNTTNSIPNIPSTKSLTTPMIYNTKGDHNNLDATVLSAASTIIENETPVVVANKE